MARKTVDACTGYPLWLAGARPTLSGTKRIHILPGGLVDDSELTPADKYEIRLQQMRDYAARRRAEASAA